MRCKLFIFHHIQIQIEKSLSFFINKIIMGKQANSLEKKSTLNKKSYTGRKKNNSKDVLSTFLNKLEEKERGKKSRIVLRKIHKFIQKNKKISKKMNFGPIKQRLQICKTCDTWNMSIDIVQCLVCEDYYHKKCLKKYGNDTLICQSCNNKDELQKKCKKCNRKADSLAQCGFCSFWFDAQCLNKTKNKCKKCDKIVCKLQPALQRQSKLEQFMPSKDGKGKKIIDQSTNTHPINRDQGKFIFVDLVKQPADITTYKLSLLSAIEKKKMNYTQDLINLDDHLDKVHQDSLDFGIQFMNKSEIQAYTNYKKQPIGPFHLNLIKDKGFDVVADRQIPHKSLICEYIGEIVTLRQCVYLQNINKNDSLMELQSGKNSEETLIIRPQKYTNIARFINGIKKNSPKANIQTIRMLYKGKPVVLLVASKDIKKGESLAYDYNAGGIQAQYDTSHFV